MTASTKIQWRVQVRKSRAHKWVNKGLFETRQVARDAASLFRDSSTVTDTGNSRSWVPPYRFGNTRVVRYVKGA